MTEFNADKGLCIGDVIALRSGGTLSKYYKIIGRDRLFYLDTSLSSVAAGSTSAVTQISNLNPPMDLVYHINRIQIVQGNVKNVVYHPQTTTRFGTERANSSGVISDMNDQLGVDLWLFKDFPPALAITNDTTVAIAEVLRWIGWTYRITQIEPTTVSKCHEVTIGGICR